MQNSDRIIYADGRQIDWMKIAYLTFKTIMDIGISVRLLTTPEFEHELNKQPKFAELMKRIPDVVKPSNVFYGSARQNPPCINFENLLRDLIKFKNNEDVELNLGQITLVMVLMAIHEYAHTEMDYKHCEKVLCPMSIGLPISKLENKVVFKLEPCKKHEKLKIFVSRPEIQGLL
jgi:hypothetical protein